MLSSMARNKVKKVTWSINRYQAWTYDREEQLRLEAEFERRQRLKMMWHVTVGCSTLEPAATGNARLPSVFRWKRGTHQRSTFEADRRFWSRHNLWHTRDFVGEVARRHFMEFLPVYQHPQLVLDPIGISKPMQITEELCRICTNLTGSIGQQRRGVEQGPRSVHQPIRDAGECYIGVRPGEIKPMTRRATQRLAS